MLEKGKDDDKIDAMRRILITMINGDPMPDLLMHIIRYIMPSRNKELKKLLYFYWEICPKLDSEGKLKQEMILVCNAIQRDLQHPNEYIRGNTLRFLSKLKEAELLEPLVPSARLCLEHRHAYVRKNAAFAIFSIYQVSDHLLPDAAELLVDFLAVETDSACKRNAFTCLGSLDRDSALRYIQDNLQDLASLDPLVQLAFIEFIRKDASKNPDLKNQYLSIITDLLESQTNTVVYESATLLTILSSSQAAVVAAASKFVELAIKEPDNNVKMITLERILELHTKFGLISEDVTLDILRILTTPEFEVRQKVINITLQMISSRNVEDVVKLLRKELQKAARSNDDKAVEYRQLLITAIHSCAIRFGEVAASVVELLLGFIPELNTTAAVDVINFVKEVVEKFPDLRTTIISKLLMALTTVKSGKVYRGSMWILGEYSITEADILAVWNHIRSAIGEIPIVASERKLLQEASTETDEESVQQNGGHKPVVLPDGTYATENALTTPEISEKEKESIKANRPPLRALLLEGDFYLGAVLSSTLVKLILRLKESLSKHSTLNALKAEAMLIMVSILRVGESSFVKQKIDEDSSERIMSCLRFLAEDQGGEDFKNIEIAFLQDTKLAFKNQLLVEDKKKAKKTAALLQSKAEKVDDSITFRQFSKETIRDIVDDEIDSNEVKTTKKEDLTSRLTHIVQLTGFSDPVYAEAYVKVHQFDVVLDVLIVNQTTETLRNMSVEFATLGDLKVVDRPSSSNIGPHGFYKVTSTIKVTSADTGVIFGNIIYDGQHSDESTIVILNDIHVDIMDYIKPATCKENQFRKMWNEFEWENKITVKSAFPTLKDYLNALLEGTNMNCLTPGAVIGEECQFLSANLYSKSSFGEDALANLCIEKKSDGPIIGHVRIRSKGQGLLLSLGDRVAAVAKKSNRPTITAV